MAKKRPPGWKKKETRQKVEVTIHEGQEGLEALLSRLEKNPENFGGWGYLDADGNEYEDLSFLSERPRR